MLKNLLNRILPTSPSKAAAPARAPAADDIAAADALIAVGNHQEDGGYLEQAEAIYRSAVGKAPRHARAHLNLGIVLAAQGDTDGAANAYETVLSIDPQHPFGNYNFARLLFLGGDLARAEALTHDALRAKPDFAQALILHSNVLDALGKTALAVDAMEAALRLQPDNAGAWLNQAALLVKLRRFDNSEVAVKRVLDLEPRKPVALALLSRVFSEHGFATQAIEPMRAAIDGDPATLAYRSSELLLLNCEEGFPASDLFRRHVEFGVRLEQAVPARFDQFQGSQDPQRRLRIGYVSADFCIHPLTIFLLPVLERHDRAGFEIFCYSSGSTSDHVTERVLGLCDHWIAAKTMSDSQLADAIHADGIDILVDLAGHTKDSRLAVFSQRPAPVQATWLGYLNTTGLTCMDYRLCDRRTDPPESSQPLHTEKLIAFSESQWCYRPFFDTEVARVAPLERNGHVTFGSFNAALKISPAMYSRWAQVLSRVPTSRLMIADLKSERKRAAIRLEMTSAGISDDRIEFVPRVDVDKYLELFNAVDLSLDTFPYGGGTTTFDSLWMGVPVVTALGETPVSRSAGSILTALDLDDWVAPGVQDYVEVAVARASDHQAIVSLRRSLRQRMKDSPLTDEARYVKDLETAYRDMWIAHCK